MDYKNAGVDIEAGYKSVELMKDAVKSTVRPEVLGGIGGFAGAFSLAKIKEMEEDSFLITGYELGLRGVEDMCFVLETKDGKSFKAKPQGDRALKEQYMEDIDDILGQMGDVKYFHFTPDGIPNLPVFLTVRYDLN